MAGDLATIALAFSVELPTGLGSIGAGLTVCAGSAGGLCPGGAVAMVAGGALVLQAGGSSLSAAIGLGKTANILYSRGRGRERSSQKSPRPPGFNPKWKKDGQNWVDPKTDTKWRFHAEDAKHWDHRDVYPPGKKKYREPIDPTKGVFK